MNDADKSGGGEKSDKTARVFFALWPDDVCAGRLHAIAERLAAHFGGRAMRKETLHLTLAFVGEVSTDRLPELLDVAREAAEEVRHLLPASSPADPGLLFLDRLGCWQHKRLLWIGSTQCPPMAGILAELLAGMLRARGYALPLRPLEPHVTLVRKVKTLPEASVLDVLKFQPLSCPYRGFVLVRSRLSSLGPAYERLGAWRFGEGAASGS